MGGFFFLPQPPPPATFFLKKKKTVTFRDSIFHNGRRTKSRIRPEESHTLLVIHFLVLSSRACFPHRPSPQQPSSPSTLSLLSLRPLKKNNPNPIPTFLQQTRQPISIQHQNNQTHEKSPITANINIIQTLHPTPVRSAIRSMRFIVPLSRTRVLSKLSFIFSARVVELVISADMASDICTYIYIYILFMPF